MSKNLSIPFSLVWYENNVSVRISFRERERRIVKEKERESRIGRERKRKRGKL